MKIILLLLIVFSLAGCATTPQRYVTELKPIKLSQVDTTSTTHGYIAASAFYQLITYGNLGGIEENYVEPNPPHCNMFRPDQKCPVTINAFAPISSPSSAYDLSFNGFAVNTLYFFEVPVGQYRKKSRGYSAFNPNYEGAQFEIKPGKIVYYGHYHVQQDLERNMLMGDHFELICSGVANKLEDAKPKLSKIGSNLEFDTSLIHTFKMNYPNDGRNPCTIQTVK